MNRIKLELIFYRRITGQEVQEIPAHAIDVFTSLTDAMILRALVLADLKKDKISKVAIRYSMKREAVRSIGRQHGIVK